MYSVLKSTISPDFMFRELSLTDNAQFVTWAMDKANQTEDNFKRCGIFHPVCREVWINLGLIGIEDDTNPEA